MVSDDGWSWVLAWAQLGVKEVECIALTDRSREQLDQVASVVAETLRVTRREVAGAPTSIPGRKSLLCAHIGEGVCFGVLDWMAQYGAARRFLLSSSAKATKRVLAILPADTCCEEVRHRRLGGLTMARTSIYWRGDGCVDPRAVRPGGRRNPIRPLGHFLEPSIKLFRWRRRGGAGADECWRPFAATAKPFPWPFRVDPPWVEAPTVYLGGQAFVERPLIDKELSQLLDLREDWGLALAAEVWTWNGGATPPLHLLMEPVLAAYEWLTGKKGGLTGTPTDKEINFRKNLDWGRVRPPGLATTTTDESVSPAERMMYFGWVWEDQATKDVTVATKADDAEMDLSLWAVGGNGQRLDKARDEIRRMMRRWWIRKQTCAAGRWFMMQEYPTVADRERDRLALLECVERCRNSTWWDWKRGSRLLFWRWGHLWQREARDGAKGLHTGWPPPRKKFPKVPVTEAWIREKDLDKLRALISKGYLEVGPCTLVVPRFPVPKGDEDIRVVWDFKRNGFNAMMYTPWFFLLRPSSYARKVEVGTHGGDCDVKEQFHNYLLHEHERPYAGVEIPTELIQEFRRNPEGPEVQRYMRWTRLVFGWQSSPYFALRMHARAIELAKRRPDDPTSAFAWNACELNLPGMSEYDPGKPRVRLVRSDGKTAADVVSFFDDIRPFGPSEDLATAAVRQIISGIQHLGVQDATRKRRPVSTRPGAWAGAIVYTDKGTVRKFLSKAKWEKLQAHLDWFASRLEQQIPMNRANFRSKLGFLLHATDTYGFAKGYLQGFFLSYYAYRPDRDSHGYRRRDPDDPEGQHDLDEEAPDDGRFEWSAYCERREEYGFLEMPDAPNLLSEGIQELFVNGQGPSEQDEPETVEAVPRLYRDVQSLKRLFKGDSPIQVLERPVNGANCVSYGGGDASGEGFGSVLTPLEMPSLLRLGFWVTDVSKRSSNYRELRNAVEHMREEVYRGRLSGTEVWFGTDNLVAESGYFKGRSSNELLDELILEMIELSIRGNFVLHFFHMAGTRMIAMGIDGASRGELHLGALAPHGRPQVVPLHLDPITRSPGLVTWVRFWAGEDACVATPEDWFYNAQQSGVYDYPFPTETWIWSLPPAAALDATEELGNGRLKRHEYLQGIVLVPNLLKPEWFRRFRRVVDFYFTIPAGVLPFWPACMHEPLTVGVYLPLLRFQLWDWRRVPFLVRFAYSMQAMCKEGDTSLGSTLREFWAACDWVANMPERLVRDVLCHDSWRRFLDISRRRRGR